MKLKDEDAARVSRALRAYARLLELVEQDTREENYRLHALAGQFDALFPKRDTEIEPDA